ncbi:MAG: hypothetical protein SFV22_10725, partial [Saprospiraceae bacterium]|nr:hypothetical protein [Saprospiraceae bacterium]
TAATVCTQVTCPPAGGAQAQTATIITCTGIPIICGGAQAQTLLSVPPMCPTVAPMCPPAGGAQAQTATIITCTGIPIICGGAQAQALSPTTTVMPTHLCFSVAICPTAAHHCELFTYQDGSFILSS